MSAQHVQIDVYSDISCPCGKRRLDKALQQLEGAADFSVVYHSYIIDHATAPGGEDYLAYNVRRWGSDGWTRDLRRSGRPDGAAFADWQWWPNSLKGHQLVLLAQERGKGREAKEALLRKTYEEGQNISDIDVLVQAAAELGLGMSDADVRAYLQEDRGRQAVLQEDKTAKRELGISGVPYFIIGSGQQDSGRQYALSGAQPTAALVQTITKVLAEQGQ